MKAVTRAAARAARPLALTARAASRTRSLTVVGWHRVDKSGHGVSTSVDDFTDQLDVLADWGATVVPLADGVRLLAAGQLPRRAVALTFDDGYASVVETCWPELQRRGWPATLFAVSGYLDGQRTFPWDAGDDDAERTRLVDRRTLQEAAASGLDIGSHTVSHRWLPTLAPPERDAELRRSRADLEELLGHVVTSLAYPTGGWNRDVRDAARRAGYTIAVTVEPGSNRPGHDPLALRRPFVFDRAADFRRQLDGGFDWCLPIARYRSRREPRR